MNPRVIHPHGLNHFVENIVELGAQREGRITLASPKLAAENTATNDPWQFSTHSSTAPNERNSPMATGNVALDVAPTRKLQASSSLTQVMLCSLHQ